MVPPVGQVVLSRPVAELNVAAAEAQGTAADM